MHLLRIIFLIVQFAVLNAAVLDLNDQNRNQIISNSQYSLIYFFKDNCKACNQFKPTFEQLSQYYDNSASFQILQCDSGVNRNTKRVFQISSFPSVILYNPHSKKVLKFTETKNLINLINFINDNTDAINDEIDSKVQNIEMISENMVENLQNSLIVLTMSHLPEWEEYEFPSHEYQQLAYQYPNIKFHIIFVDLVDNINEFLSHYKISNFPSVVYLDGKSNHHKFKLFKTFSFNHMSNDKLSPSMVTEFLAHLQDDNWDNHGKWFGGVLELTEFLSHQQYEFIDQTNYGFNIRQHKVGAQQDEEIEYLEMLEKLEM